MTKISPSIVIFSGPVIPGITLWHLKLHSAQCVQLRIRAEYQDARPMIYTFYLAYAENNTVGSKGTVCVNDAPVISRHGNGAVLDRPCSFRDAGPSVQCFSIKQ